MKIFFRLSWNIQLATRVWERKLTFYLGWLPKCLIIKQLQIEVKTPPPLRLKRLFFSVGWFSIFRKANIDAAKPQLLQTDLQNFWQISISCFAPLKLLMYNAHHLNSNGSVRIRQHCRLCICEYWSSWTNSIRSQDPNNSSDTETRCLV